MLEMMEGRHLEEWKAFREWENEMETRRTLQAKADATREAMARGQ